MKNKKTNCLKNSSAGHCVCVDDPNLNEEVSRFNLEWSPLLSLPDNDMIDEDKNYILMQLNMSVPPENP